MENKLCILVCDNFERETRAVIESEGLDDVVTGTFAPDCSPSLTGHDALTKLIESCQQKYAEVFVVAGCCLPIAGDSDGHSRRPASRGMSRCFDYLSGKTFNDWHAGQGSYLLTPGWLERWRHYIAGWGFDEQTARQFFAEASKRLVLLDTAVYGDVHGQMHEFAGYAGLPFEVVPVGLEHFRSVLRNAVLAWRLRTADKSDGSPEAAKPASDYAMAFDLLGSLARARTESQAIENMLDLFARMFAPGKLRYYSLDKDLARVFPGPPATVTLAELDDYMKALQEDFVWTRGGSGFVLRVGENDSPLGLLEVDDLAFPQYREQYLSLAIVMGRVCAMSILNGRSYQEQARLNEMLTRHSAELEASNRELEAFSYSVSHDLRAPLRSMHGFSEALLEDCGSKLDGQSRQYLMWIKESSELMGQLIDDLLQLSRVIRAEMRMEPVDLSALAGSILADMKKAAPDRQIEYRVASGLACTGDGRLLRLALQNLLDNAWKFTGKASSPRIDVGAIDHDGGAAYFVRDNGVGFDMIYADKLFRPFQRLHKASEFPGTGIGLATVQRLIHRHGGCVWAEAEPGKGATFYFTLHS